MTTVFNLSLFLIQTQTVNVLWYRGYSVLCRVPVLCNLVFCLLLTNISVSTQTSLFSDQLHCLFDSFTARLCCLCFMHLIHHQCHVFLRQCLFTVDDFWDIIITCLLFSHNLSLLSQSPTIHFLNKLFIFKRDHFMFYNALQNLKCNIFMKEPWRILFPRFTKSKCVIVVVFIAYGLMKVLHLKSARLLLCEHL